MIKNNLAKVFSIEKLSIYVSITLILLASLTLIKYGYGQSKKYLG